MPPGGGEPFPLGGLSRSGPSNPASAMHASSPSPMLKSLLALALAAVFLVPASVQAQAGAAHEYDRIASLNPLALVVLGLVSAEYEAVLGEDTSWGVSAEYFNWRDRSYISLDGKLRYYVSGRNLEGLSVGALAGFTWLGRDDEGEDEVSRRSGSAVGLGFVAENQWLLGADERLAVTLGGGGKRLFFLRDVEAQSVLPVVRLSLGWAF